MFTSLKRVIRSGIINFRRQGGLSLATIFVMVLTISLITSLFLFREVTHFVIAQLQEKIDVSVYFKQGAQEKDILEAKDELIKVSEVKEIKYVSHEDAVKNLLEKHPELKESIEETAGMLNLASINIKAAEASQYEAIAGFLDTAPFKNIIEKVDYYQRKPIIEKIFSTTRAINRSGIILSLVLAIVAFLVAFNHVKLAICNSSEEIGIQRLVGASNWFIRGPFLIQGIISGFSATLITFLISFPLLYFLSPRLESFLSGFNIFNYFTSNLSLIILIQLITGIGLGTISSLIAMRRYLEV